MGDKKRPFILLDFFKGFGVNLLKFQKIILSFFIFFGVFFLTYTLFALYHYVQCEKIVLEENGVETVYKYDTHEQKLLSVFYALTILEKTENTLTIKTPNGKNVYVKYDDTNKYLLVQKSKVRYSTSKRVAILYISTGKYIRFWADFYQEMEKYFLPNHEKTYFLFTDHDELAVPKNVIKVHQDQLPWPYITLKRYHFFDSVKEQLKQFDFIYFLNGTMIPVSEINEDIFPTEEQKIMVTLHPGYFKGNPEHFPYDRNSKSNAYIPKGSGQYYFMGGFNGGTSTGFLKLIETLKEWTDTDIKNNVIPSWHDESMLNAYVYHKMKMGYQPLILIPIYAIPQTGHANVDEFRPFTKQLILDKAKYGGHTYLRKPD